MPVVSIAFYFCQKTFAFIFWYVIVVCQHQHLIICVTMHDVRAKGDGDSISLMITCQSVLPHIRHSIHHITHALLHFINSLELEMGNNKNPFGSLL